LKQKTEATSLAARNQALVYNKLNVAQDTRKTLSVLITFPFARETIN
jgi:hypothetical protein